MSKHIDVINDMPVSWCILAQKHGTDQKKKKKKKKNETTS